jgi:ammonium transporter, Amt family
VHGVGGAWGAVATGLFIAALRLPEGVSWGGQLGTQLQSIAFTALFAPVATLAILYAMRLAMGDLRVGDEDEYRGLDLSQHSETAYASPASEA